MRKSGIFAVLSIFVSSWLVVLFGCNGDHTPSPPTERFVIQGASQLDAVGNFSFDLSSWQESTESTVIPAPASYMLGQVQAGIQAQDFVIPAQAGIQNDMLILPAKFKSYLGQKNTPSYIVKLLESEIYNEQTLQAHWEANSYARNVDFTPTPPAVGDVIVRNDGPVFGLDERANPKNFVLYGITYGNGLYVAVGAPDADAYIATSTDGITWIERSNPKSLILYGITYGNGLYVAVGYTDATDAYIVTSTDGITWIERSNPKNFTLYGITYGNGLFVAVGYADGTDAYIVTSTDGVTWIERSNPKNFNLYDITYDNGLFVAVGAADGTDAYIITSSDGVTWIERSNPKNFDLYGITYANGFFVAVGNADGTDAYIVTSTDGITWMERANPKNFILWGVTYGNGLFVAVGYPDGTDAYIVTSTDGITWIERANPKNFYLYGITYAAGLFVAVGAADGTDAYIVGSRDGTEWKIEQANPKNFNLYNVTYGNGLYVAVGQADGADAYIVTSTDGITWIERANPKNFTLTGITYDNGLFVAVGGADGADAYIVTSTDGITWTESANPKNFDLTSITYGNGLFAAVGYADGVDAYIVTSADGITWIERSNPKNIQLSSVIYSNGFFVSVGNADGTDAYIVSTYGTYYVTGAIKTQTMDLGSMPVVDGLWKFQNLLPSGTAILYEAWASDTGSFTGEETSLGTVIDGQAITVRKRYYRVRATLTVNTALDTTPTLRSIMARFPTYQGYSDNPRLGYEAALQSASALTTKIGDFEPSSITQITFNLAFTKSVSDYLKTKYPKNKEARLLAGFMADGFVEADYYEYYRGIIDEWDIGEKDIIPIKVKDFSRLWDVPVPIKWQSSGDDKTWTAMHPVDVMLDIFQGYIGSTDAEIDISSFNDVKLATPGWVVTRTITGNTIPAKDLLEELRKLLSAYFIPQPNGRIKLKRFSAGESAAGSLSDRDFITKKWEGNAASLINQLNIYFNWDGSGDNLSDFTAWDLSEDATSKANWKETITEEIKDKWTQSAQSAQVEARRTIILGRYANPPEKLIVTVDMRFMEFETGDIIAITTLRAPSSDMSGITAKPFQIIQKTPDFTKDRLSLTLLRQGSS